MINYSLEAEKALLGCILIKPDLLASVSALIGLEDFYGPQNKSIWEAIENCANNDTSVDAFTVSSAQGGTLFDYIIDLSTSTATVKNYESYCKVLIDHSSKRKIYQAAQEAINSLSTDSTLEEVQEALSASLVDNSVGQNSQPLMINDALTKLIERTDDRYNSNKSGYKTGFKDLDENLQIEGGRLIVIAGRPGSGKSTLAQNIVENNCAVNIPCFIATMEMPEEEVVGRIISSQSGISTKFLSDPKGYEADHTDTDDQWSKFSVGVQQVKDWPLMIDYCPGLKVSDFKMKVRDFFSKQEGYTKDGQGMMVIDYLGLMKMTGDNRVQSIGAITKELKTFAGEMGIPLILLAQLNRGLEQRNDKRPINSDLRDSGEIEEDGDIIMFVYREEMYDPDTDQKGIAEIIIGKNRGGNLGNIKVMSQLHRYKFTDAIAQNNY